jgi:hypothetical protein
MMTFRPALFLCPVLLAIALAPASAQSTATLSGSVVDPQGARTPGVTILVRNQGTGVERTVTTDSAGQFLAASLLPGVYRVEARLQGFKPQASDVELAVARTVVLNFQLAVGNVSEEVSVSASHPAIETSTISVGQVINQRTVQEIPLNGRHFVDLGLLVPGSVTPPQSGFLTAPLRGQGSFAFNTAGNREDTVNFMVNGVNLNDMVQNQITFQPSINTVSEFKVDNSTFSAEYGRNSGAIVNILTRSGSNEIHGEAFEFLRNDSLDARNFFNRPPARKSPFKRNQFGGSVGGPIAKNKTFFFGSYEGLRQRQGIDINSGVLREDERAAVTDPVSRQLLELIPAANTTGTRGEGRFVGSATAPVDIDQWTGDVNHLLRQNDTVHAYYAYQRDLRGEPTLQLNTVPGFGDTRKSNRQIMTLNETHIFGANLVNEARFGFNRINITFTPNASINPTDYGINNGVTTALGLPQISIIGLGLNFGGPSGFPQGRTDSTFVLSDTVSYLRGRHTIKLGGEWRRFRNQNFTSDTGTFQFGSLAEFQQGIGNSFGITLGDRPSDIVQQAAGVFAQDSFKAASNLTFEVGVRYDLNLAPSDSDDRFVVFDAATASLLRVGSGGRDRVYDNDHEFVPRIGVIWDPFRDGRTSVRAAYAISVDQPVTNVVTPTTANPPLATPLTFNGPIRLESALSTASSAGLSPASVAPDFKGARVQSWNVNVERQVAESLGVMVGYFGSSGDRLRLSRNVNQFIGGVRPFLALSASSPIAPGASLGNITEIASLGESQYNGLWISANQRMTKGLQFNASYTLSKSIDFNSLNSQGVVVQDSFNVAGSKGLSDFDARHRFVVSAIYELPLGGNVFLKGWQVGVIAQAQSGNPINIVTNIGTFTGVANTLRPDIVGSPDIVGNPDLWFDNVVCDPRIAGSCGSDAVFALPVSETGQFHLGNLGRNALIGPGFTNVDLSLVKTTPIGSAARIQFRVEAFNVFNHPNLGQPGRIATVGSATFGVISTTRFPTGDSGSSRQIQFAIKALF